MQLVSIALAVLFILIYIFKFVLNVSFLDNVHCTYFIEREGNNVQEQRTNSQTGKRDSSHPPLNRSLAQTKNDLKHPVSLVEIRQHHVACSDPLSPFIPNHLNVTRLPAFHHALRQLVVNELCCFNSDLSPIRNIFFC
jgi:hypothetical protein